MHPSHPVDAVADNTLAHPETCPEVEVPVEKSIFACAPGLVELAMPIPQELTSLGLKLTHPTFGLHAYPENNPVLVVEFGTTFTEYGELLHTLVPLELPSRQLRLIHPTFELQI